MKGRLQGLVWLFLFGFWPLHAQSGWGLNSRLTWAPPGREKSERADLRAGHLLYLREDLTDVAVWPAHEPLFRRLDGAGYKIVAILPYDSLVSRSPQPPGETPDLRDIYRGAETLARREGRYVSVWELYNEPDTGFCPEPPDQFTAEAKAAYLGLKAVDDRPVLLPSLGLPPGPWLERAAANGLLAYGDAYNLHYYGHARDLARLLEMTRRFLRGPWDRLPLWLTEIGIKTPLDGPDAAWREARQARYLRETMRTAEAAPDLAAFMPYAFQDGADSLAAANGTPTPALAFYLRESRTHRLRAPAAWIDAGPDASRIVLQWAPEAECVPDKVSGAYEFTGRILSGAVRLYNFSSRPATGKLEMSGLEKIGARLDSLRTVTIPPLGRIDWPVRFVRTAAGYLREAVRFLWRDAATGSESPLSFGLATMPRDDDFSPGAITAFRPGPGGFEWIDPPAPYAVTAVSGPWLGLNGLKVSGAGGGRPVLPGPWARARPGPERTWNLTDGAVFWLDPAFDREEPAMAVARVAGLPASDFLRLRLSRRPGADCNVRADLIDNRGERFTVFENGGVNYFRPAREVWLNWSDFHLYFWSRYPGRIHALDPAAVREIQLRFRFARSDDPVRVSLETMRAQR